MESVTHRSIEPVQVDLDELARLAAREYIALALEAERRAYLEDHAHLLDADDRRLVVGHGHGRPREVTTGAGAVEVRSPRVRDRREGERFVSALLPPYLRRSPRVGAVLPLLYLHGLSSRDFVPALSEFFGSDAGLSASTVTRLTESWQAEHAEWERRDLSGVDYVSDHNNGSRRNSRCVPGPKQPARYGDPNLRSNNVAPQPARE
jgi:transposase-like protein